MMFSLLYLVPKVVMIARRRRGGNG